MIRRAPATPPRDSHEPLVAALPGEDTDGRAADQPPRLNPATMMPFGFDADTPYLFQTDRGYVLQCTCCRRFEVSFKQMQLRMEREAFAQLADGIGQVPFDAWEHGSVGVLRLTPPGSTSDVRMMLTRSELRELKELLRGAAVMSELDDLIEDALHSTE